MARVLVAQGMGHPGWPGDEGRGPEDVRSRSEASLTGFFQEQTALLAGACVRLGLAIPPRFIINSAVSDLAPRRLQRRPADIVAAVIRRGDDVVLVHERGEEDPEPIWMLPGGRVEPGEDEVEALRREVHEETGLVVDATPRVAFEVEVTADSTIWRGPGER